MARVVVLAFGVLILMALSSVSFAETISLDEGLLTD